MYTTWDLHKAFPEAKLHIIPDAGHAQFEPGILDALGNLTFFFSYSKKLQVLIDE
jgi:proline iminopeptidase